MPRLWIKEGAELLARANNKVRARMNGTAELSSANDMPNPDIRDFDNEGRLRDWKLNCADRPDCYYLYLKRLTANQNGTHKPLRDTVFREQTGKLSFTRPFFDKDDGLTPGSPIPAVGRRARVAAPAGNLRVKVMHRGSVGYQAGVWYVSYAWIVGRNPVHSYAVTAAAPATKITIMQGQNLEVFLPTPPEGATGIAILMGRSLGTLRVQKKVNLQFALPVSRYLTGGYNRNRMQISTLSYNRTSAGDYNTRGVEKRYGRSNLGTLRKMDTGLSYRLVTDQGVGASQFVREVSVRANNPGYTLQWRPRNPPPHATGWIPEFRGKDGLWYALLDPDSGSTVWPLRRFAEIQNNSAENSGPYAAEQGGRTTEDESGLANPTEELESIVPRGEERLPPGKYIWRATYGVGDEQSGPGPGTVVELLDSGIAFGQPATGVSHQKMRVYRPFQQQISNARFTDQDADGFDIDWDTPAVPNVTVTTDNGVLTIEDRSNSNLTDIVRLADPVPVNLERISAFRIKGFTTDHTGGAVKVRISALRQNANGSFTFLKDFDVQRVDGGPTEDTWIRFGKRAQLRQRADAWVPNNTTHVQLVFVCVPFEGPRNFRAAFKHIAFFSGHGPWRKRWPVDLGLYNDRDVVTRRTPDNENDENPYPPGPFCRVVENPSDPAHTYDPQILAEARFNDGTVDAAFTQRTGGGGNLFITEGAAYSGPLGLRCEKTSGQVAPSSAYLSSAGLLGRTKGSVRSFYKMQEMWDGIGSVLQIQASDQTTLLNITYNGDNGRLVATVDNGGVNNFATVHPKILQGSRLKLEAVAENLGSSAGRITINLWRGGMRQTALIMQSLDWRALPGLGESRVGAVNVPAGQNFGLSVDEVALSEDGDNDGDPIPGNYVEYWSPEDTPPAQDYFMSGMRVPLIPNTDYVLSAYVGSENLDRVTTLLKTSVRNVENGVQIQNPPLCVLEGDQHWRRFWFHFRTGETANHLRFDGGWVGGGLLRAMGFQLDRHALTPRPFDPTNFLNGYLQAALDTRMPGGDPFEDDRISKPASLVSAHAVVFHPETDEGDIVTSHTIQYRTAETLENLDVQPWKPNLLELGEPKRYVEFRIELSSTDPLYSPEVSGVLLDLVRPYGTLTRADGTEFDSGTVVRGVPAPSKNPAIVEKLYPDGRYGKIDLSRGQSPKELLGVEIDCFRDSTAEDVRNTLLYGDGAIEVRGVRYKVSAFGDKPNFAVNRRITGKNTGTPDGIWLHESKGWNFQIVDQEPLG